MTVAAAKPMQAEQLWRDRSVMAWVVSFTLSQMGDAAFTVALAWTAVRTLSPGFAGLVVAVDLLPQAVLTLWGGVMADRFDTRLVIGISTAARVALLVVSAIAWQMGVTPWVVLLGVGLGFGIAAGLGDPASATLGPQLVPPGSLITVAGWRQVTSRLARLGGAPIGAFVVAVGGFGWVLILNAVSFLAVTLAMALVVRPRYGRGPAPPSSWRSTMVEGLTYLWRTPVARTFVLGLSALNIFVIPVGGVGVALRVSQSGWSAIWVGAAEACVAIGAIIGSVYAVRHRGGALASRSFGLLVVQGVGIAAVGIPSKLTLLVASSLVGLTAGAASAWLGGLFQLVIDPARIGRVMSVATLGDLALIPVMTPLFGVLADMTSILTATIVFGVGMSLLCAGFAVRPEIRGITAAGTPATPDPVG